jgi:protein ERP2
VQSGGSFDIDFDVKDPRDVVILDGKQERQGDYILTANHVGEYAFCFENDMSTITEKLVDFDIMVRDLSAILRPLVQSHRIIGRKRT